MIDSGANTTTIMTANIANGDGRSTTKVRVSRPVRTARSKTLARIERQLIDDNMVMRQSAGAVMRNDRVNEIIYFTPTAQCGFKLTVLPCMDDYRIASDVDPRRVVSLACMTEFADLPIIDDVYGNRVITGGPVDDRPPHRVSSSETGIPTYLEAYVSKLPLMCINVGRLVYTTRAFGFRNRPDWNVGLRALDFYLRYDTGHTQKRPQSYGIDSGSRTSNVEFSTLLHRLRSSGYLEYVLGLGKYLEYDVEVVLARNRRQAYVYKYVEGQVTHGVLTAFYDASRWYVCVSATSRVRNKTNMIDMPSKRRRR